MFINNNLLIFYFIFIFIEVNNLKKYQNRPK